MASADIGVSFSEQSKNKVFRILMLTFEKRHTTSSQSVGDADSLIYLTRFNKIVIQGTPQMAIDKEAIICILF